MGVMIGVCGTNFCSFVSAQPTEKRKGSTLDNRRIFQIFQLNDSVLYGMSGVLDENENFLDPLSVYLDFKTLTLRMVYKAAVDYLNEHRKPYTYLIGGKDNKGNFCMYEVHYEEEAGEAVVYQMTPDPEESNFGVSCTLPDELLERQDEFLNMVGECIMTSDEYDEMMKKLSKTVKKIAAAGGASKSKVTTLTVV